MRYIGSKANIMDFLEESILQMVGTSKEQVFADLFAGTTVVSKRFKKLGFQVVSNDYLAFSFILQNAFIRNNEPPVFGNLPFAKYSEVLKYLNTLEPTKGFFYENYCVHNHAVTPRNYFSVNNAKHIDSILAVLRNWRKSGKTNTLEDSILRASLIEAVSNVSNISGTYGAYLKCNDPRMFNNIELEPIEVIRSQTEHQTHNVDINHLVDDVQGDILYLDPPYNQRQYPPYYHIWETISLDDNPPIYGKTGRRPYKNLLSPFCIKNRAAGAFRSLIRKAKFKHIFVSYNTEGIVSRDAFFEILGEFGTPSVFEFDYRRYRSNGNGSGHNKVKELLFYVRKKD